MPIEAGGRLGSYEILSLIGSGGMGVVYRARDLRLGRTVAIKVLPAEIAGDAERRTRFEREARAISALAHPHVCTLYDIGRENGVDFLVMEHLEGESLEARLTRGRVPLDEALTLAIQIASALYEAHRLGVVHRDLKPGNVMVTKNGARLLDFGLARLQLSPGEGGHSAQTRSVLTTEHTVLGTLPYMAPEQLLGRDADSRADIFSFGVLLYELTTGLRPFTGDTGPAVMAAILEKDATAARALSPQLPPALERLIEQCLVKDRDQRWQSARDLELQLTSIRERVSELSSQSPRQRRRLWGAVGALALLVGGVVTGALLARRFNVPVVSPVRTARFEINLAAGESIHDHNSSSVAFSSDGTKLAYAVTRQDSRGIYIRALSEPKAEWVGAGDRAASPFFSPDGEWVAFESGGSLMKVKVGGGSPVLICETPYFAGATWTADDTIVLVPSFTGGLFSVPAAGGVPTRLTRPQKGEGGHMWPQVLPDGRVLFSMWMGGSFDQSKLAIYDRPTGKYHVVLDGGFHGRYTRGRLVFARANRLFAVPFDLATDRVTGSPEMLAEGIAGDTGSGSAIFAVDSVGSLAYVPGVLQPLVRSMVVVDRSGTVVSTQASGRAFNSVRSSPDGSRLIFWIEDADTAVWVKHLARDPLTRLTFSGDDHGPSWSPDGKSVAFESGRDNMHQVFVRASDGSGVDRRLTGGDYHHYFNDWTPDGKSVAYVEFHPQSGADLWIVNVDGTPAPKPVRVTRFSERYGTFSPDGQWIAYVSNETGRNEVYVQAVARSQERIQITDGGGEEPAWSRRGDELFYRASGAMMAIAMKWSGGTPQMGRPVSLFRGLYHYSQLPSRTYDVAPDGRFIMVTLPDPARAPRQLAVMLNRLN